MESYVFTHTSDWDIFDTGVESAEVDFFGLLQDVAMDAFDGGHFPATMGTIGDLAEAGHYGIWGEDEYEHEDGGDYRDAGREDEDENDENDEADDDDDADRDEDEEDEDLEEEEIDHLWVGTCDHSDSVERGQDQEEEEEELDYDPFPDRYDISIDDDDRGPYGGVNISEAYSL